MTKATAATIASALVTAGYVASIQLDGGGVYRIQANDPTGAPIAASVVATFATNNGVTGRVYSAEFI